MKNNKTIYKGVPLTGGRTEKMIDTIIEKRNSMGTKELAELVGFDTYRPLMSIFRYFNYSTNVQGSALIQRVDQIQNRSWLFPPDLFKWYGYSH